MAMLEARRTSGHVPFVPDQETLRQRLVQRTLGPLALARDLVPAHRGRPSPALFTYAHAIKSLPLLHGLTLLDALRAVVDVGRGAGLGPVVLDGDDETDRFVAWSNTTLRREVWDTVADCHRYLAPAFRDAAIADQHWLCAWIAEELHRLELGVALWPSVRERLLHEDMAFELATDLLASLGPLSALRTARQDGMWHVVLALEVILRRALLRPEGADLAHALRVGDDARRLVPLPTVPTWQAAREYVVDSGGGVSAIVDALGLVQRFEGWEVAQTDIAAPVPLRPLVIALVRDSLREEAADVWAGWEPAHAFDVPPRLPLMRMAVAEAPEDVSNALQQAADVRRARARDLRTPSDRAGRLVARLLEPEERTRAFAWGDGQA